MISIYDISKDSDDIYTEDRFKKEEKDKESGWVETIQFDEFVKKMFIKKRPPAERAEKIKKIKDETSEVGSVSNDIILTSF